MPPAALPLVELTVMLPSREVLVLRPRDSEALIDEARFERDEFLPYWAELWPSALALARAVAQRTLGGRRMLELGCGLALPSVAAALGGAHVLATDWSPEALSLATLNAAHNGARVETALCAWESPERIVAAAPWDLVVASDVLYEERNVGVLVELLPRLVGPDGEVLIADPGRPAAPAFLAEARADWTIETSPDELAPGIAVYRLTRRA